jgi:iron-sulfur cluster repair protein YtfE (RIC family)
MTETVDIFQVLKTEHRNILSLVQEIETPRMGTSASLSQRLTNLRTAFQEHHLLECDLVYPLLDERDDFREFAIESVREHEVISHLIDELCRLSPGDPDFHYRRYAIQETITSHFLEEETEIFPKMFRELDVADLIELAEKIEAYRGTNLAA